MKTSYVPLMTATAIVSSLAEPMFGNNSAVPKNSTTANSTAVVINNKARTGISCGPGNGVWVLGGQFYSLVDQFCLTVEGSDISDGYSQSDTYLTELSLQGKAQQGDAGKVIYRVAIKNNGETPAYHINDWMDNCATPLKALIDQDCAGERGDTKGGTNTIGKIVFEATINLVNVHSRTKAVCSTAGGVLRRSSF